MRKTVQKRTVPRRRLWLFSGFALLLIALQILHLPENLNFTAFAFGEPGGNLSVVYMVRHGMHPNVDFGHPYGLLGVLFSNIWFRITGLTPAGYWAGIFVIELAMCAVLTEFAVTAELPVLSILLLFVSFPIFIWVNYFNFAHAIEALCLMAAATAHLKGRYGIALAAVGAAVLARPALGYVYGFLLLCIVMMKVFRTRSLKLSVLVLPACTTGCLAIVLAWQFGVMSLMRTVFPFTGVTAYRALGFGFFNQGMAFWLPSPFTLRFYLGVPGFWLLVSASLLLLGPLAVRRARDASAESLRRHKSEVLGAASVVIFVWIFFAFAHQYIGSWILYLWFAVWAAALLPEFFRKYAAVIVVLILIALNADRHQVLGSLPQWSTTKISSLFPLTLSQGNEDEQIKEILSAVQGRRTVVLAHAGAMALLHDGLGEPLTEFFMPGIALPDEERRMKSAANAADMVIMPTPPWSSSDREFFSWVTFLDKQSRYRLVLRNPSGFVLTRTPAD
jgi:predicted small integral membrane protein